MKVFKLVIAVIFSIGLVFGTSSCATFTHHDSGQHRGWNKNSNNPHHYNSTNPGNAQGKHKNK